MCEFVDYVAHTHTHTRTHTHAHAHRIRTDHNEDNTLGMLREWAEGAGPLYRSVDLGHEEQWLFADRNPLAMTDERYVHISQLRQQGLEEARKQKAHYLLVSK